MRGRRATAQEQEMAAQEKRAKGLKRKKRWDRKKGRSGRHGTDVDEAEVASGY